MSATAQTDRQRGLYSHPGPLCYCSPLNVRSEPDPLGGYCHSSRIGRQTGEDPCGLTFAFPTTDGSGPDRLFRRGIAGPDGRRPKRQTRGLELGAEQEMRETPT